MCGIAGWIAGPGSALTEDTLESMLQTIVHRGPDDRGTCKFRSAGTGHEVFLGHRRLAIIDPKGAHQPMCDAASGLALTFNGEIYNFRELREELTRLGYGFVRDSDTEVLLRAYQHWESGVVNHLRGMFAFAIWDARNERLFLARDRFGEKPLFLCENGSGLYFASEIKALLRVPGVKVSVNLEAVWDYLAYRYVPGPKTLFTGIRKLMPGTTATWERGKLKEERYWMAPDRSPRCLQLPQRDTVSTFLSRLDEAVKLQMVSDVPFGAFLSGGIDSSTIVALMSRHNSKVKTFSVGFSEEFDLLQEGGVLVSALEPDSPAAVAGLGAGDVLIAVDDFVVAGIDDLHRVLTEGRIGHPVRVDVIRGLQRVTVAALPAESPG